MPNNTKSVIFALSLASSPAAFAVQPSGTDPGTDPSTLTVAAPASGVSSEELQKLVSEVSSQNVVLPDDDLALYDADLWARIRGGFAMSDVSRDSIDRQVAKFSQHPAGIEQSARRASKYMYHLVEQVEKRHLPTELVLLPFIESSFNPSAFSSAKAAGLWQFVPSTGLQYNLKQNMFKDERRDVIASTDAALNYLEKLYDMFGDWQLALAAYNWGEGKVMQAIRRNQAAGLGIDFDSLAPYMPEETRTYVPKLLAMKEIISNPVRFGVNLPTVMNKPYFASIPKTRDMDVKVAAELAEMPVKEFRELNPQFNKPVITGGDETKILLPTSRVKRFQENLSKWGKALTEWTSHSVTSAKERVASIAKRFGTTPDVIRAANNIPGKMEVAVGSTLLVPKLEASADSGSYKRISEDAKIELRTPPKDPPHHVSRYRHSGKSGQDGVGHKRHRRHHSEE
jgi:membrane-bound lytic murein transglycosylase D